MIRIVIALALLTTPAEACHRFSAWFYPWPQPCAAARWAPRAAFRVLAAVVDPTAPSAGDIALLRAAMIADAKGRAWP
jgi:hypothetical protein